MDPHCESDFRALIWLRVSCIEYSNVFTFEIYSSELLLSLCFECVFMVKNDKYTIFQHIFSSTTITNIYRVICFTSGGRKSSDFPPLSLLCLALFGLNSMMLRNILNLPKKKNHKKSQQWIVFVESIDIHISLNESQLFSSFFYGTVRVFFDRSRNFQLIIILSFDCYWLILTDDNSSMPLMGRNKAQQRRSSSSLGDTHSLITLTKIMSFTFFTIWILTSLRGLLRAVWISYKL